MPRFSEKVQASLEKIEQMTQAGENMTFVLALNYSSRSEMTTAVQNIAKRVAAGEIKAEEIDEKMISESLYTSFMPDPDLIIRTSGECRLSNFLRNRENYQRCRAGGGAGSGDFENRRLY